MFICWLISSSYISCKGPCDGGGSIIHIVNHLDLEALHHIRQVVQETSGEVVCSMGLNDVFNGFNDDGWSLINYDGAEDVITTINFKNMSTGVNPTNLVPFLEGILCVKASLLLQDYRQKDPEVIVLDPPDTIHHSYDATTHFESTVHDVLTMYRKIIGKEYASTNQVAEKQMPVYQLRSKILCCVIDVQLKVEADADKVFAQMTLLLESNV
ncbi:hypothetical protein GIB67_008960 [Kingdonia uniflora]|uniref:Uncharacterized protein n=1 Tax=Kingdonia uniflora TaxID=39325 RepID=A0A7J7LVT7_9MAGN|nr:hypothetical protein GIB67_008960 [Kingdonia uniflora]